MAESKSLTTVNVETGEIAEHQQVIWTEEQVQLIKDTVAKGSTDDELKLFLYNCKRTGLDPLAKQAHYIKRWDSSLKREVGTFQTGIDGYRVIAERSGSYAGQDAPILEMQPNGLPDSATVTVYRTMPDGERVGISATAYYDEYVQTKKDGSPNSMWSKMPRSQLAKCAEALALRKAFPNDLSGIYTYEEMAQAENQLPPPSTETKKPKGKIAKPLKTAPKPKETAPQNDKTANEPPETEGIVRRIKSKFDGKCGFCGEKHIKAGQEIVLVDDKWGAEECYLESIGQEQPPPPDDDDADTPGPMHSIQVEHLDKLFMDNEAFNDTWLQFKEEYPQFMTVGLYKKWSAALETGDNDKIEAVLSETIRQLGIG